jgi:hypothetical protein
MHRYLPLSVLGVLVAGAMAAGIAHDGGDGVPELSEEQIRPAWEQGVTIHLDEDRGPVDEDFAARLLAAAHPHGDPQAQEVLAVSRGAFHYTDNADSPGADHAWFVVISNVEALCFGGDMCPDPPYLGTEVVALTTDDLEPIGNYWVS